MTLEEIIKEHQEQSKLDRSRGLERTADFLDKTVEHLQILQKFYKRRSKGRS